MTKFKLATLGDLDVLLKLLPQYYEYDGHPYDAMKAEQAMSQLISNPSLGEIWLIYNSSEALAIGYMVIAFGFSLECGGREAFIDELFLHENFRGQGIGTEAIEHAILRCAKNDVQAIRLEVVRENSSALNLYKKLGFTDLGRHLLTRWPESVPH